MKRKVIQLARKTHVVSLPCKWFREQGLKKGDEVEVIEEGRSLIINNSSSIKKCVTKISIDVSNLTVSLLFIYVNAAYKKGADEIELLFSNNQAKDPKRNRVVKTMDIISLITDRLIGMEIVRQSKNSCLIKEVSSVNEEEFELILNRIFVTLETMSQDSIDAYVKKDNETLENICQYMEININKLTNFCLRILNKFSKQDSNSIYLIAFLLEDIGDQYTKISNELSKIKENKKLVDFLKESELLLRLSHKFFSKSDKKYFVEFHKRKLDLKKSINESKLSSEYNQVLNSICIILDSLMEINDSKCILNLDPKEEAC
ncbi:phosphate uptake regulator PhoU [Candidatus Woesearchaeota archaeon]|jgi:phosphate uptake regulator|nr:phosphate uptake regulator PhoU [archaeon]MBT6520471.1 phosphate uptake regulator PhoU [Candidatus Woesearchaeota archaeon]MBT7368583.1 phosphate uptake regulator PhoU [Candidatus Woesearchaeota archaeon]